MHLDDMTRDRDMSGAAHRDLPVLEIGKLKVRKLTERAADELILSAMKARQARLVAFCNAHTVNMAEASAEMVAALEGALLLNDGAGLDMAARLLSQRAFPANLNGTDFIPRFLAASSEPIRIFLLGGKPDVAEGARSALQRRYPWHRFVGTHHGYFDRARLDQFDTLLGEARPDLVILCMGQPLQEIVGRAVADRYGVVVMAAGAFLDFASGRIERAPAWIRRLRLEWLFRLAREPRRLAHRYVVGNPLFILRVLRQRVRDNMDRNGRATPPHHPPAA